MEGRDLKKGRVVSLHKGMKLEWAWHVWCQDHRLFRWKGLCVFKTDGFSAWSPRWSLDCKYFCITDYGFYSKGIMNF